jgi:hypothetical protein
MLQKRSTRAIGCAWVAGSIGANRAALKLWQSKKGRERLVLVPAVQFVVSRIAYLVAFVVD